MYILGQDLGGLTVAEAEALLSSLRTEKAGGVVLGDGENTLYATWPQVGARLDTEATALAAFQVGHDIPRADVSAFVHTWLDYHPIPPVYGLDTGLARDALTSLSRSMDRTPTEPSVSLTDGTLHVEQGTPGRALDVEASLVGLIRAAQRGEEHVDLIFSSVPPRPFDIGPLQKEMNTLLEPEITLTCYDLVSDHTFAWTLDERVIIEWIQLIPTDDPAEFGLTIVPEAVHTSLAGIAAGMGEGRGFRVDDTTDQVLALYRSGGGALDVQMTYAPGMYTVQAGDTATSIATAFGMPLWPLTQANPDTNLDALRPGQDIVIPSQNVLTPLPPVPDKRIIISLSTHSMAVYERGILIHEWPVATGREESPTAAGTFQVLEKDENAYASLWDLQMPSFIALYTAGPGFYNGIHALPILSSGQRLWTGALGTAASYGCIILGVEEAQTLYDWAEIGTPVVIQP